MNSIGRKRRWWERSFMMMLALLLVASSFMTTGLSLSVEAAEGEVYYVDAENGDDGDDGTEEEPFATIGKAFDSIVDQGTIVLLSDVILSAELSLTGGKSVTIQSKENEKFSITRGINLTGVMIRVNNSGGTVVFKNLIIDGNNVQAVNHGVYNAYSNTIFEDVELINHHIADGAGTAVISSYGNGSIVTIKGETLIQDNTITNRNELNPPSILGAGTRGVLVIEGGTITNNEVIGDSNGVIVGVGLNNNPRFQMTGGEIKGNKLNGEEYNASDETVGNVAVYMRGTSAQARFEFGGTAYVYNNLNSVGEQRNVFLKNAAARDSAFLSLVDSMQDGAKVGVYANIMPSVDDPIVDVGIGYGGYTANAADAAYFESDIATSARIRYDSESSKVILAPLTPTLETVWLDKTTVEGNQITLTFSNEIALDNLNGFMITVGADEVTGTTFQIDPTDSRKLILTLQDEPTADITLDYVKADGNLRGTEGDENDPLMMVNDFTFEYAISYVNELNIAEPSGDPAEVTVLRPELSGTMKEGSTVSVVVKDGDGNVVTGAGGNATVDDGSWTFTPPADLANGDYTFEVTATSLDGTIAVTKIKDIKINVVDKTLLQAKVTEINGENLVEVNYTPASWNELQAKLTDAQGVLDNPNATQAEVDTALDELTTARDGLVAVGSGGLASLTPSTGTLTPSFATSTYEYTMNVGNNSTQLPLSWVKKNPTATVTMTANGQDVTDGTAPLQVGTNTIVITVTEGAVVKTYTITVNRASAGGGGGSTAPSQPATEQILVPVETGEVREGQVVEQTPINRTRENGTVLDAVTFTQDRVSRAIENVRNANQDTARVVIPDANDEVGRIDFTLPNNARAELAGANTNLEIYTENARVIIPNTSLASFAGEVYFRLIPIKEEQQRTEVESRARVERLVREVAGDQEVNVVARPMTIETNLQSRPVTLILPLRDVVLPTNAAERTKFLNDLVIFIEHSDGEKRLVRPQVVEYKGNELGLEFGVTKFSTFTILNMEGWQDNFHAAYINGYTDGTFRPSAAITRAEMAAIFARNLDIDATNTARATYPDVASTHWATKEIEFVRLTGLMVGDNNGNFRPNAPITRAEMAAIAARYKELASSTSSFTDVSSTHWAAGSIGAVQQAGIVGGYEDGTFRPNGNLSRAEAVTIVNRLFERGPLFGITTPSFKDVPTTHWAFHEVEEAAQDHFFTPRSEGGENVLR